MIRKINPYTKKDGTVIYFLNGFSNTPKAPAVTEIASPTYAMADMSEGQRKAFKLLWKKIHILWEKDGKETPFVELIDRINAGEADEE